MEHGTLGNTTHVRDVNSLSGKTMATEPLTIVNGHTHLQVLTDLVSNRYFPQVY